MRRQAILFVAFSLAVTSTVAIAQVKRLGSDASEQDFITGLTPPSGASALKFRGVRVLNANPADQPDEATGPSVAVDIKFALNSATLTDPAKTTLKQMAAAMKSTQLAQYHFLLQGFTDSTGKPEHNLALSQKRAEAAQSYLVNTLGVDASRLQAVGRGQADPLDPAHPESPVNRRVGVVNMGG